jgi:hypothetical protein
MIRALIVRCRTVAPPLSAVAVLVLVFGLFSVPQHVFGQQPAPGADPPARRYLILASVVLGIYRVAAFHPYFRASYLRWLKSTPWNVRKPLPLGPVELVPADSLGVGLIILLGATLPVPRSIEFVNIFLFSHMLALAGTFWRTGSPGFGYIAVLLLGFVPFVWTRPWQNLVLLTGIYLLVHEGLWRALKRFPWETDGILADFHLMQTSETNPPCGWFFDRFHRDIMTATGISRIDAILGCMLGSWWLFVLASMVSDPRERFTVLFVGMLASTTGSAVARFATYIQGCRPPISLWGRIGTFRWIIPGFDQILIAPACSLLVGPAALVVYWRFPIPAEVCFSIAAGVSVLIGLIAPPRLKRWRLTGQYRLVATFQESQTASLHKMGQP